MTNLTQFDHTSNGIYRRERWSEVDSNRSLECGGVVVGGNYKLAAKLAAKLAVKPAVKLVVKQTSNEEF